MSPTTFNILIPDSGLVYWLNQFKLPAGAKLELKGHRWQLWVFHSAAVVHYVLDPTRATSVIEDELGLQISGILSCDRYSAYKCFMRLNPGVLLAFCWAECGLKAS